MVGVIEISHFEFCNLFETEIKKTMKMMKFWSLIDIKIIF